MSASNIVGNLIGNEIQIWTEKLNDMNKYLSDLQEERQRLMARRLSLEQTVGRDVSTFEYFRDKPDIDTIDNREIYYLVNEIHNLELRSLELDEKLRIVEIEREVKDIIRSFQPAQEDTSHLSSWYRELKCRKQVCSKDECTVDFINYLSEKHSLRFTFVYKGVALMINITESQDKDSLLPVYRVRSDIFIDNLTEKASELLKDKKPVEDLLTFVKLGMEEDILPFINCDDVTEELAEETEDVAKLTDKHASDITKTILTTNTTETTNLTLSINTTDSTDTTYMTDTKNTTETIDPTKVDLKETVDGE
ncbi:hypothetical protein SNE40_009884 [Patella caerulea]|uniref:Uncharacterized protein n=2 Tax=Patella caerulea TaxID=87958 RepID=A0AAN8PT53_PATCE